MTHAERRKRLKAIVLELKRPHATILSVAQRFGLSSGYITQIGHHAGIKNLRFDDLPDTRAEPLANRNARVIALVKKGETLHEAGKKFGLSRERVRQILRDAGIATLSLREETMQTAIAGIKAGADLVEIAQKHHIPPRLLRDRLAADGIVIKTIIPVQNRAVQIIGRMFSGESFKQIAERFGNDVEGVKNLASYARQCGIPVPYKRTATAKYLDNQAALRIP